MACLDLSGGPCQCRIREPPPLQEEIRRPWSTGIDLPRLARKIARLKPGPQIVVDIRQFLRFPLRLSGRIARVQLSSMRHLQDIESQAVLFAVSNLLRGPSRLAEAIGFEEKHHRLFR